MHFKHFTVHNTQCTLCTVYSAHITLNTVYTLHCMQCTLHITLCHVCACAECPVVCCVCAECPVVCRVCAECRVPSCVSCMCRVQSAQLCRVPTVGTAHSHWATGPVIAISQIVNSRSCTLYRALQTTAFRGCTRSYHTLVVDVYERDQPVSLRVLSLVGKTYHC